MNTPARRLLWALSCVAIGLTVAVARAERAGPTQSGQVHILPPATTLPGRAHHEDEVWYALICDRKCELKRVSLRTDAVTISPYDDPAVPGQQLWTDEVGVIALFQGLSNAVEGPVPTALHANMEPYPIPRGRGTLEIEVRFAGQTLRIVPRLRHDPYDELRVYLESDDRRQALGDIPTPNTVDQTAKGPHLLYWAGDIDRDGKLDLLMGFTSCAGVEQTYTLFLSSSAKAGDFVEKAGSFTYLPLDVSEC